jgi:hypothetical protein
MAETTAENHPSAPMPTPLAGEKLVEAHVHPKSGRVIKTFVAPNGQSRQEFADKNGQPMTDPRTMVDGAWSEPDVADATTHPVAKPEPIETGSNVILDGVDTSGLKHESYTWEADGVHVKRESDGVIGYLDQEADFDEIFVAQSGDLSADQLLYAYKRPTGSPETVTPVEVPDEENDPALDATLAEAHEDFNQVYEWQSDGVHVLRKSDGSIGYIDGETSEFVSAPGALTIDQLKVAVGASSSESVNEAGGEPGKFTAFPGKASNV